MAKSSSTVQAAAPKVKQCKFANGDFYVGGWQNSLPEGQGKYEWADGSCYEGSWRAGAKHGYGKYTWISGASYEGDWFQGGMHGVGTFEALDGSSYRGGWRKDLKHGLGRKVYANGDVYEGLWADGKPDGPGRYIWVDCNEYDGDWKAGRMHGQGTFVWKTGERYDGEWRKGQEEGAGVFTFKDSSRYCGFWHNGKKHGIGILRPTASLILGSIDISSAMHSHTNSGAVINRAATYNGSSMKRSSDSFGASGSTSLRRTASADAAASSPGEAAAAAPGGPGASIFKRSSSKKAAVALPGSSGKKQQDHNPEQPPKGQASIIGSRSGLGALSGLLGAAAAAAAAADPKTSIRRKDVVLIKEYGDGRLLQQFPLTSIDLKALVSALAAAVPAAAAAAKEAATAQSLSSKGSTTESAVVAAVPAASKPSAQEVTPLAAAAVAAAAATAVVPGQSKRAGGSAQKGQLRTLLGPVPMFKGHCACDLMVQLQRGIRWSVARSGDIEASSSSDSSSIQPRHIEFAATATVNFPREGTDGTSVHPAPGFQWKEYAPDAFRVVRQLSGVSQADHIRQLCSSGTLQILQQQQQQGIGSSGSSSSSLDSSSRSLQFVSSNWQYVVVSVTAAQAHELLQWLPRYLFHLQKQPGSLLPRFYGLYRISGLNCKGCRKVYFVVLNNLLCSPVPLQCVCRLNSAMVIRRKQSSHTAYRQGAIQHCFKLLGTDSSSTNSNGITTQVAADTNLLAAAGISGYSLLLGFRSQSQSDNPYPVGPSPVKTPVQNSHAAEQQPSDATDLVTLLDGLAPQLSRYGFDQRVISALGRLAEANMLGCWEVDKQGEQRSSTGNSCSPTLILATRCKHAGTSTQRSSSVDGGDDSSSAAAAAATEEKAAMQPGHSDCSSSSRLGCNTAALPISRASTECTVENAPEQQQWAAQVASKQSQVVLYFGIAEVLRADDKLGHKVAGLVKQLTAPKSYAERFRQLVSEVFPGN